MTQPGRTTLNAEQQNLYKQLSAAVAQIKQANELLAKTDSGTATERATALLLAAIARAYVMDTAKKHDLPNSGLLF